VEEKEVEDVPHIVQDLRSLHAELNDVELKMKQRAKRGGRSAKDLKKLKGKRDTIEARISGMLRKKNPHSKMMRVEHSRLTALRDEL
jgi:hypothetical protein